MLLTISVVILLYLLFSITGIITIVAFIEKVHAKRLENEALFLGIFISIMAQLVLIFFASLLFRFGSIIYIISGFLLLYLGMGGILRKEKKLFNQIHLPHSSIWHVILTIAIINITLSLDNIVAVISVTQDLEYITAALLITIFLLFILITFVRDYLHHVRGLDMAASVSMLFLGFKFLVLPIGIELSNAMTSIVVLSLCAIIIFIYNKGHFEYIWKVFNKNVKRKVKYLN